MARYLGPKCRQCRREKQKLFLKGERCMTDKCAMERRAYAPGQHGQQSGRKNTDYGLQLREKQKVKRIYGMQEKQFRTLFAEADRRHGVTGHNLLTLLESRLDNVTFRMGLGASRNESRQLVRHRAISVNGKRVTIPSYRVRPGDVVSVHANAVGQTRVKSSLESAVNRGFAPWLSVDADKMSGQYNSNPEREQITEEVNEHLIVELYSK